MTKPNSSLLTYPQFPNPLTESVVRELFTPTPDELRWVWHTSSVPEARLGLLRLLKSFPLLGRFPAPASIPASIAAFLAQHANDDASDRDTGITSKARQCARLSTAAPAGRAWLSDRMRTWPHNYRRSRWIDLSAVSS